MMEEENYKKYTERLWKKVKQKVIAKLAAALMTA